MNRTRFRKAARGVGYPIGFAFAAACVLLLPQCSFSSAETLQSAEAIAPNLALPHMSRCMPSSKPMLPKRWRAVGLMAPFTKDQLDVGEFVYDGSLPAMRATIYGVESGTADILITKTNTYQLFGPHDAPMRCLALGRRFVPPSRQWLFPKAKCVGEAPVITTPVQWWKMSGGPGEVTTWQWYASATRLPWRTMFATRSDSPAVIGGYSMTYFPTFQEVPDTDLKKLSDFCRSRADHHSEVAAAKADDFRALVMSRRNEAADAERHERIEALVPGLTHRGCSKATLPKWPSRFAMTTFMTPVNINYDPFATEIFYDWDGAHAQRTRMFSPGKSALRTIEALLISGSGYDIKSFHGGAIKCRPGFPGIPKPDWASAAQCECKGVIENNPVLSPGEMTQIMTCPTTPTHILWVWYRTAGNPVMFMETAASGTGISLADYYGWAPYQSIPPGIFDLPRECVAEKKAGARSAGGRRDLPARDVNPQCFNCHLGRGQLGRGP